MKYLMLMYLSVLSSTVFAQTEQILYVDNNLAIVKKSKAAYKGVGTMNNGTFELKLYDKKDDYHILTAHFTDATLAVLIGSFISYFRNGNIENSATYVNGKPDGLWLRRNMDNTINDSIWYRNGTADSSVHYNYSSANKLTSIIKSNYKDSSFVTIHFDENATLMNPVTSDTITKSDEIVSSKTDDEVEFPGGNSAMNDYFQRQFHVDKIDLLSSATSGSCTLSFTVDKMGRAGDFTNIYCDNLALLNALHNAILNIIWLPASENGRTVKAKKQITAAFYPSLSELSNKKEVKTYLDLNLKVVNREQAAYYGTMIKEDNLIKYILTDAYKNNELFSMHFTDSSLQTSNGRFVSLFGNGNLRMEGSFVLGRKNGWWLQWNNQGWVTDSSRYDLGVKTAETTLSYQPDGSLMNMNMLDFNSQTMRVMFLDDNEVTYDNNIQQGTPDKDGVYRKVEMGAFFPGGDSAWSQYVKLELLKKIHNVFSSGICIVALLVDTSGKISNVKALTMRQSDLARIAEKIIKNAPDWIPAEVNGKKVKFSLLQVFSFRGSYRW